MRFLKRLLLAALVIIAALSLSLPALAYSVPDNTLVYVTSAGEKYHRKGCSYLTGSSTRLMTIELAKERGFTACSRCESDVLTGEYISDLDEDSLSSQSTEDTIADLHESNGAETDRGGSATSSQVYSTLRNSGSDYESGHHTVIVMIVGFLVDLIIVFLLSRTVAHRRKSYITRGRITLFAILISLAGFFADIVVHIILAFTMNVPLDSMLAPGLLIVFFLVRWYLCKELTNCGLLVDKIPVNQKPPERATVNDRQPIELSKLRINQAPPPEPMAEAPTLPQSENTVPIEPVQLHNDPPVRIEALAKILHTTPAYLMGWTNDPTGDEAPILPEPETEKPTTLTDGERELVSLYRELNDEGQGKLVGYADDLVTSGKYIKTDSPVLDQRQV